MPSAKIKICGLTNLADARAAAEAGADLLGFIFFDKSPRRCEPDQARRVIEDLRRRACPLMAGVFVNERTDVMLRRARECRLDIIQLHGAETNEQAQALRREGLQVFKAFRIAGPESLRAFEPYDVDGYLCDTPDPRLWGGTGQTFDHEALAGASASRRIILAGGLNADNVTEAIRLVQPWAVDVASGVEASPGRKDHEKIRAFIVSARFR